MRISDWSSDVCSSDLLSRHDGMSQSDLAEMLELGRAALGGLVDRLEALGLVLRGSDDHDRRAMLVFLTPAGGAMIDRIRAQSDQTSEALLQGLDPAQRHLLAEMLVLVQRILTACKHTTTGLERH